MDASLDPANTEAHNASACHKSFAGSTGASGFFVRGRIDRWDGLFDQRNFVGCSGDPLTASASGSAAT
jgi:hypothetical protein